MHTVDATTESTCSGIGCSARRQRRTVCSARPSRSVAVFARSSVARCSAEDPRRYRSGDLDPDRLAPDGDPNTSCRPRRPCSNASVNSIADGTVSTALATTLPTRSVYGSTMALVIGVVVGGLVSSSWITSDSACRLCDHRAVDHAVDRVFFARRSSLFGLSEEVRSPSSWYSARRHRSPTDSSPASTTSHPSCSERDT